MSKANETKANETNANTTALITTKGNEFKTNVAIIDNTASEINEMLKNASTAEKALASKFLVFRKALKDNSNVYQNTKFPDLINTLFGDRYSGNTAFQYAQCAELFEGLPDVWDFFNFGKLIAMKTLCTKQASEKGMSIADFFAHVGSVFNLRFKSVHDEWIEANEKNLYKIAKFESEGDKETADLYRSKLSEEPPKPIVSDDMTDKETAEKLVEYGRTFLYKSTDKVFKEWLADYKSIKNPKAKTTETTETTETAETTETTEATEEPKELTLSELKASAIANLQAIIEKTGEAPKTLTKAIEYLEK